MIPICRWRNNKSIRGRKKRKKNRNSVDFVCLADSTASNIFMNVGGHSWPPIISLEQVEDVKYATMSADLIGMDS